MDFLHFRIYIFRKKISLIRSEYLTFSIFTMVLIAGIYTTHGFILRSGSKESIFLRLRKSYLVLLDEITELIGVSRTEIFLEILMKSIFLGILQVIISQVLGLDFIRTITLMIVSALGFIYWMFNYRRRIFITYREEFEVNFADFVESLSLAVNSGLSLMSAVSRVIQEYKEIEKAPKQSLGPKWFYIRRMRNKPPFMRELSTLESKVAGGESIQQAFDLLALRLKSNALSNFVDILTITLSRGTPLATQLGEFALSMREAQKRLLMERAGRAEIKMMVPVVFLLLPISVLFALWPSFQQLQQLVTIP